MQGRTDPAVDPDGRWPKTIRIDGWSGLYETCNIAYRADALARSRRLRPRRPDRRRGHHGRLAGAAASAAATPTRARRSSATPSPTRACAGITASRATSRCGRRSSATSPRCGKPCCTSASSCGERSAAFDLAALGAVLLALRKPTGALLLLPYARLLRPAWRADGLRGIAEVVSYDVNTAIGLVAGSWRARTVVL